MDEEGDDRFFEPEDDCDALNDETFGDDGEDYKWDEPKGIFEFGQQDPFTNKNTTTATTSIKTLQPNGKDLLNFPDNKSEEDILLDESNFDDPSKENENDYYDNNSFLEESISRLVLDEYDDDDDDENSKKFMLKSKTSFAYFTPPQLAKKNLQWYAEKESYGSSLLGNSVWSAQPVPQPPASVPSNSNYINSRHHLEKNNTANHTTNDNIRQTTDIGPPPGIMKPSGFKTVDEVEKELLESSVIETPKKPKILSLEEVERELMKSHETPVRPIEMNTAAQASSPLARVSGPGEMFLLEEAMRKGPAPPPGLTHPAPAPIPIPIPGIPQMMMNMPPSSSPHQQQHIHHVIQQQLQQQQQQQQQGFQRIMPMMASPPKMPFQQQQQQVRGVLPMPPYPQNMAGYNVRMMNNSQKQSILGPRPTRSRDPDAGLMNEKDKQRLRNIQIIQLQNDHPHHTDYYCLMKKIKVTLTADQGRSKFILEKMYPKRGGENKSTYQPATFENSLGKLQAISALAPRKAIDTVICLREKASSHNIANNSRYLLLEIERLYETLLIMEESDIRLSVLGNGDEEDILRRKKCTDKVLKVLSNPEKVDAIMSTNKGKLLISRLISLMDQKEKLKSFNYILGKYKQWSEGENNNTDIDKCYPYLRHCIFELNQMSLLECVAPLNPKDLIYKKLGLSIILAILYQAENLIGKCFAYGKPCDEFIRRWNPFLTETMKAMLPNLDDLEAPVEIFVNIFIHLQRFKVEKQYIEMLNSKLRQWSEVNGSRII